MHLLGRSRRIKLDRIKLSRMYRRLGVVLAQPFAICYAARDFRGDRAMAGVHHFIVTAIVFAGAGWLAAQGTTGFLASAAGKAPRFPQLTVAQLDDKQRPLGEAIRKISSIGIAGPYNPMLRSPEFGQKMFDLLDYLRWHTSVPLRLNEFAILITSRLWRSQVEWYAHEPLALKAGLSPLIIADLKANKRPDGMQGDEAAVYDFVMELSTRRAVPDEAFARLRMFFTEQQVVDLTAVTGTYVTVAMLLAMAEEHVPAGKQAPFQPGDP
jgi:4-carboxymuconolactone decarboxylase